MSSHLAFDALKNMSLLRTKIERYGDEVFFREAWLDVLAVGGDDPTELIRSHALVLFKPDGVAARAVIPAIEHLAGAGFTPVAAHPVTLSRHMTRALWQYRFNVASIDRVVLHDLINSAGSSLLVALRDDYAAQGDPVPGTVRLTDRKGASRPERRRPDQMRSQLGIEDRLLNYLHTSDEPADLVRELAILMDRDQRRDFVGRMLEGDTSPPPVQRALEQTEVPVPQLTFDRRASLERLAAQAAERGWDDAAPAAARALSGDAAAGLEFWHALVAREAEVDRWDLVVLGSAVIDHDEPGRTEQTIGDAPLSMWQEAVGATAVSTR